jgi:hypothetical protein
MARLINGMKTTIDSAGRLVISRELRRQAGIEPLSYQPNMLG